MAWSPLPACVRGNVVKPPNCPVSPKVDKNHILATLPDNFANNRIMMAIEYRRRGFYAFEFYRIWPSYNYLNSIREF